MNFSSTEEAISWADAWVGDRSPADLVVQSIEAERAHFERFNTDYGRLVGQFEIEYQALAVLIDHLNFVDRSAWPEHRSVQFALVGHGVRSFYSAFDRLVRGYYEDCMTLTRGLYETFVRLLFISCHQDIPYNALLARPPKGERRFNLTNFLEHDLKLEWGTKYEIMSVFAHSNSLRVLQSLQRAVGRAGEPERFGVNYAYEPDLIEAAAPFLQFVLLSHTRFVVERFGETNPRPDADLMDEAQKSAGLLTFGLRTHPKSYWRGVAEDLDLLFAMLPVADAGDDWKEFLNNRRADAAT